jgi:hypothetical protein
MANAPSVSERPCAHPYLAKRFVREGKPLNGKVFMVACCMDCGEELDRKRVGRGFDVYSKVEK